jgi:low affinity Fe/Cu permease
MNGWKGMAWTVGLVFVVAAATQFLALGGDVFHTSETSWQVVINSGVAAVLALIINAASPWITRYGVGSKS